MQPIKIRAFPLICIAYACLYCAASGYAKTGISREAALFRGPLLKLLLTADNVDLLLHAGRGPGL